LRLLGLRAEYRLNREFDVLYFVDTVAVNNASPAAPDPTKLPQGHPPITGPGAKPQIDFTNLIKAEGGQTIEQIFAAKATLGGKEIKVRAKVVKFNAQIMGRNWLHIQDGTGAPGANDLTVTTDDTAKVGDTVLVTGNATTSKDFGHNYKYDLIIENAKVTVE